MRKILLIPGILLLIISIASLFFVNFNFGFVIVWGVEGVLILYGLFYDRLIRFKWLHRGILTACAAAAVMSLFLGLYGIADDATFDEDAAVVLGAGVRGEQVSLLLASRLDAAAEYSAVNPRAIIVVSGGQGPQEDVTEAVAMERYLIGKGVPSERIIKEEAATSTYENLLFSKAILDRLFAETYRTVVITNDFHVYRTTQFAEALGYNVTHLHAGTMWYTIPKNYLRECAAVMKMWLDLA